MVIEIEFYEKDTQRFRAVRLSAIDNSDASVMAALKKDGQKVMKIIKVKIVEGKAPMPQSISSPSPSTTVAPTESSDDSKGTISLFQPLGF
jgi:hypothetical protein